MTESRYYCKNCGAQIKSTDTICPKCGKNLSEVGRKIEKTFIEEVGLVDSVQTITGSLSSGYNRLSETFNPYQLNLVEEIKYKDQLDHP